MELGIKNSAIRKYGSGFLLVSHNYQSGISDCLAHLIVVKDGLTELICQRQP
jgi:hypothetical protein